MMRSGHTREQRLLVVMLAACASKTQAAPTGPVGPPPITPESVSLSPAGN